MKKYIVVLSLLCCAFGFYWHPVADPSVDRYELQLLVNGQWVTVWEGKTNLVEGFQARVRSIGTNGMTSDWVEK